MRVFTFSVLLSLLGCYDYDPQGAASGGTCGPATGGNNCNQAGYVGCTATACCSIDAPYFCAATQKCYYDEQSAFDACGGYGCTECGGAAGGTCQVKTRTCNADWPYYCSGSPTCMGTSGGADCKYCYPNCVVSETCNGPGCRMCN